MEENHSEGYNPQWVVTPVKEEEEPYIILPFYLTARSRVF